MWLPSSQTVVDINKDNKKHQLFLRSVSKNKKVELKQQLIEMQAGLKKNIKAEKQVSCPNVFMEFNGFHIKQVLDHCSKLFTIDDIYKHVEIWRYHYAVAILNPLPPKGFCIFEAIFWIHTLHGLS